MQQNEHTDLAECMKSGAGPLDRSSSRTNQASRHYYSLAETASTIAAETTFTSYKEIAHQILPA